MNPTSDHPPPRPGCGVDRDAGDRERFEVPSSGGDGHFELVGQFGCGHPAARLLRGLTTVSFFADDVAHAQAWYTQVLGIEPYFARPIAGSLAYAEFRVGDYEHELGIIDRRFAPPRPDAPGGAIAYWHVDDVRAAFDRLVSMGATAHEQPTERGPGFVTASVVDPFGNVLGVMYNAHYLAILERQPAATAPPPE